MVATAPEQQGVRQEDVRRRRRRYTIPAIAGLALACTLIGVKESIGPDESPARGGAVEDATSLPLEPSVTYYDNGRSIELGDRYTTEDGRSFDPPVLFQFCLGQEVVTVTLGEGRVEMPPPAPSACADGVLNRADFPGSA
ncbi:MAG: hypothetical protein AAB834_06440 [Patescibacteria group bacterium]